MNKLVLAGDIGATKTNLGLFVATLQGPRKISFSNFASCGEAEFISRVKDFCFREGVHKRLAAICFGVAGPVHKGWVEASNLGLELNEKGLQKEFSCPHLTLVNDLFATAAAIPGLGDTELAVLQAGNISQSISAASVVLAPGTGLGMAFLVGGDNFQILASEGGHADFAPRNELEVELWRYLKRHYGRVSRERLLSGPGLLNIYSWFKQRDETRVPSECLKLSSGSVTNAGTVVAAAAAGEDIPAVLALETFVSLLGSVAGDLAVTGMASAGLYLAGGIPAKIIDHLRHERFLAAFCDKGRMASWLKQVPVKVVLNPEAPLFGAAQIALNSIPRN